MMYTVYGQPATSLFDDEYDAFFATPQCVSLSDMRNLLKGLEGNPERFSQLSQECGMWIHNGEYDRDLRSLNCYC